ncbi:alpha/beta fold hydrolase [Curtobacterium flaccumfaciens pv. flaccumfaciens]|uniref:alpha/beta fold hydrolase n=1 Tax=Curtobacterium flaccumfaciens TaxID=2035 RepID=UPI003A4DC450
MHNSITPGQHTVTLDGVRVSYDVRGSGPLCIVHSGGPGIEPDYLRMPEVEQRMTTIYVDPVGTGQSDKLPDGDYSVARYAHFVHLLIATLPGAKAHFLGHSHGGFVALQLALDHPGDLLGLIVYDGAPTNGADYAAEATSRMHAFADRFPNDSEALDAEAAWVGNVSGREPMIDAASYLLLLQRMLPAYLADYTDSAVDPQQMKQQIAVTWDPNRKPDPWDVRGELAAITTPTLVLIGRRDFICGPRWAAEIWQDIAGSELVTFTDSGHFAHLEQPAAFAAAVGDFVTRVDSRS